MTGTPPAVHLHDPDSVYLPDRNLPAEVPPTSLNCGIPTLLISAVILSSPTGKVDPGISLHLDQISLLLKKWYLPSLII